MDRADSIEVELDDGSGASSEADEDTEDEFAEFSESQVETDEWRRPTRI
jgi:TATA-binding protein-associated factor Taf7